MELSDSFFIRGARPSDAPEACRLIAAAYDSYVYKVCGSLDPSIVQERLQFFFSQPKVNLIHYSHTYVLVHRESSEVAGIMSTLRGDFVPGYFLNLAELLGGFLEKNPQDFKLLESIQDCMGPIFVSPLEYHIDTLSIVPSYQGQGLSKLLLKGAFTQAREHRFSQISLLAREHLKDLYPRFGFVADGTIVYEAGSKYIRFVAPVEV